MASSKIWLSRPLASHFSFPPSADPYPLPAPPAGSSLTAPPFTIPANLYTAVFDARVPLTIASVYAVSVIAVNRYNKANGNKPWNISKTRAFFWFVVAHNIFLAVYSGWTFIGMLGAARRFLPRLNSPDGLAGLADSLCKMHGVSGLGNAVTYNPDVSSWQSQAPGQVLLGPGGVPDATDLGRLWNEGLAFYGWLFYLSKYYEVLDTFIILAKGKRSSTLQTYHHSGAMMCMWAGMRYMASPIWMFVLLNSAIHAMMYTYYTLTAFAVPISNRVKRSLTTMQISQFVFGVLYAMLHSFVTYTAPVPLSASTLAPASTASPPASLPSSGGALIKKLLFRAAGSEGIAANIGVDMNANGSGLGMATQYAGSVGMHPVACVDTPGQTFAIWLNVLYLAPLTVLFGRFFVKSYLRRTGSGAGKKGEKPQAAVEGAGVDAWKGVERKMGQAVVGQNPPASPNGSVNGKANGKAKANGSRKH